ncbi:hypothetical protein [Crocinitomix catalasitica]|uniref:hypothetical protein n=1 Tax=Crocinitomix catalasitica TaxID=184607 RepID=UPI000483F97C|nr:hypothetical protein [Crocinitomix catalasitica]
MKSLLKFKLEKEHCLRLLKAETNETHSSWNAFSNFRSIVKGKIFYGNFFEDDSFDLQSTTFAKGSLGPKQKEKIQELEGEYKCHILVEGKIPKWNWALLLAFLLIAILVAKVYFIVVVIIIGLILIANSERQIRRGINCIIETIESR